jgi:hypothetical protein
MMLELIAAQSWATLGRHYWQIRRIEGRRQQHQQKGVFLNRTLLPFLQGSTQRHQREKGHVSEQPRLVTLLAASQ